MHQLNSLSSYTPSDVRVVPIQLYFVAWLVSILFDLLADSRWSDLVLRWGPVAWFIATPVVTLWWYLYRRDLLAFLAFRSQPATAPTLRDFLVGGCSLSAIIGVLCLLRTPEAVFLVMGAGCWAALLSWYLLPEAVVGRTGARAGCEVGLTLSAVAAPLGLLLLPALVTVFAATGYAYDHCRSLHATAKCLVVWACFVVAPLFLILAPILLLLRYFNSRASTVRAFRDAEKESAPPMKSCGGLPHPARRSAIALLDFWLVLTITGIGAILLVRLVTSPVAGLVSIPFIVVHLYIISRISRIVRKGGRASFKILLLRPFGGRELHQARSILAPTLFRFGDVVTVEEDQFSDYVSELRPTSAFNPLWLYDSTRFVRFAADDWRAGVTTLMQWADFIVVDVSRLTENLLWEIRETLSRFDRSRLMFISSHRDNSAEADQLASAVGIPNSDYSIVSLHEHSLLQAMSNYVQRLYVLALARRADDRLIADGDSSGGR